MTKLADCGGRHAAHRYAQNALSDVFRFSLAKTPCEGARGQEPDAQAVGAGARGDGRERLPRKRQPEGRQGSRDREAPQKGRGARARQRAAKKFPGLLESRPCASWGCRRRGTKQDVFKYIELYYNRQRMHSSIGYNAPCDLERDVA